jgi:pre-mRNA-splicing factor SYF1
MTTCVLRLQDIITSEDDYHFEQELMRAPYELKSWWRYIEAKKTESKPNVLNILFERALKTLPGSYKLWMAYLQIRQKQIEARFAYYNCV